MQVRHKVSVCKEFTQFPGARYRINGPYSGEEFRETLLEPVFEKNSDDELEVDLDGVDGYATSFLEESFGGLVRKYGYQEVKRRLSIKSDEDVSLIPLVEKYLREAKK
jgi:hypothetical protein